MVPGLLCQPGPQCQPRPLNLLVYQWFERLYYISMDWTMNDHFSLQVCQCVILKARCREMLSLPVAAEALASGKFHHGLHDGSSSSELSASALRVSSSPPCSQDFHKTPSESQPESPSLVCTVVGRSSSLRERTEREWLMFRRNTRKKDISPRGRVGDSFTRLSPLLNILKICSALSLRHRTARAQ